MQASHKDEKYMLAEAVLCVWLAAGMESYLSASNDLHIGPSKAASRAVPPAV